jgi:hypothetical protein
VLISEEGQRMAKMHYHEGDWFAVPLSHGGYALGIVARANQIGDLLGYFFGPRRVGLPTLDDVSMLHADQAILITRLDDRGLRGRSRSGLEWPVIGRLADWDRSAWPMPVFGRIDEDVGRAYRVSYADGDPGSRPRREQVPSDAPHGYRDVWGHTKNAVGSLPRDGMVGADHVEKQLDDLLS